MSNIDIHGNASGGERIEIEGLDTLVREFGMLASSLKLELRAANLAAAKDVAATAKDRTPVGVDTDHPGLLQDSIKAGATLYGAYVSAGGNASGVYAGPIHFGWAGHGISPQPFLFEALDSRKIAVIALYELQVNRLCEKVKGSV